MWVAVGSDGLVYGINSSNIIYKYTGDSAVWANVDGALDMIDVASDGTVWGVNSADQIYSTSAP